MKTYFTDIIPKIKSFSKKIDDLTLLKNQSWILLNENLEEKNVFIFRDNNELLISKNGRVEKAKWEYLGNESLLIDRNDGSFLFKHGFFDQSVLALKVDGDTEYAIFISETAFNQVIHNFADLLDYFQNKYLNRKQDAIPTKKREPVLKTYETDKGELEVELEFKDQYPKVGQRVFKSGVPAADGKYKVAFMWYLTIKNGEIIDVSMF